MMKLNRNKYSNNKNKNYNSNLTGSASPMVLLSLILSRLDFFLIE